MPDHLPYIVEPLTLADIDQVMQIEQVAFTAPWSARAYRFEIADNEQSTMLAVRPAQLRRNWLERLRLPRRPRLLGYAGFWLLVDDAHICTIAVHPEWRRRGLGELLLLSLLDRAAPLGARRASLEVRVSNRAAQRLYHKVGFETISRRRRYYADNNEDAYIMITPPFTEPGFETNLRRCRTRLCARLQGEEVERPETDPSLQIG